MKHVKLVWLVVAIGLLIPSLSVQGVAPPKEKRVALVIGNGAYQHMDRLNNPTHDAEDIAKALALKKFGFDVKVYSNLNKSAMRQAIAAFGRQAGNADAALLHFSGHGVQIKGRNYLMPIDALAESEASVMDEGVNVNYILDEMENARSRTNIVILDACRNNNFTGEFRQGNLLQGLAAPMNVPKGTVIVYATAPGNVASDGKGRNGLFTSGLLIGFQGKNLSLDGVLTTASNYVEELSKQKQIPYVNGPLPLMKRFNFQMVSSEEQHDRESIFWQSTKDDPVLCQEYLRQWPQGVYAVLAKHCLEKGKTEITTVNAAPPPVTDHDQRYVDNGDGTITDHKTGLIGLKNANCFDQRNWEDAKSAATSLASGSCGLSDGSKRGDWRLPTKDELPILIEWKNSGAFLGVQTMFSYWSSTTYANVTSYAWYVYLSYGTVSYNDKTDSNYVWPVRGGQ